MEAGLMKMVQSLTRSWICDTYFSLYRVIHPEKSPGEKSEGKCPGEMSEYRFNSHAVGFAFKPGHFSYTDRDISRAYHNIIKSRKVFQYKCKFTGFHRCLHSIRLRSDESQWTGYSGVEHVYCTIRNPTVWSRFPHNSVGTRFKLKDTTQTYRIAYDVHVGLY